MTEKEHPADVDGCWEAHASIDVALLDPVFLDTDPPRRAMKAKYGVDFLPSGTPVMDPAARGRTFEEFFQEDRDGNPKGILVVDIG